MKILEKGELQLISSYHHLIFQKGVLLERDNCIKVENLLQMLLAHSLTQLTKVIIKQKRYNQIMAKYIISSLVRSLFQILVYKFKNMQKSEKESTSFLFDLIYSQISLCSFSVYANSLLLMVQFFLLITKLITLVEPTIFQTIPFSFQTLFIILLVLLGMFLLLTILSYNTGLLTSVWIYLLLFLEAISVLYTEIVFECFGGKQWCQSDPKFEISSVLMLIIFSFVIYLRSAAYFPLSDCQNPLSMPSGKPIIFLFLYCLILNLIVSPKLIENQNSANQMAFLITGGLFGIISESPFYNPTESRIFSVLLVALIWTSGLIWATPLLSELLYGNNLGEPLFWYWLGYSLPIIMMLGFVKTGNLGRGFNWKQLFLTEQKTNLKQLYLQTTQLARFMDIVRKSQLKSSSPQFKILWELITFHNLKCNEADCCLKALQGLKIERTDELLQQKRFNKTVEKTLEYCLLKLVHQRDLQPNSNQLSMHIANYQLEVFHKRTNGLQLYNRQFSKPDLCNQQRWGLYFLKRKIQGFESSDQSRVSGSNDEDLAAFKHDIQVSVSMLAQFWYFLSDPKCNLKKLYDLANVLFPLKIKVDNTWKKIKQFKNIECYSLYAKYLVKMFNDKQKGLRILEQARRIENENNQKQEVLAGVENALTDQHGIIFLQFDGKNSGIMYQVNTSCQKIFGYNKGQLQGRKVNDIMPKIYSVVHDKILEHYQQTNRPKMMNRQRSVWGRSKDGYLFPFTICIKPVRNYYSQTSQVYASIKRDLWVRQHSFFFTDSDFNFSDISASFLGLYPSLHGRLHLKKKIHITEIFPDFQKFQQQILVRKEPYEFTVERTYSIGKGQQFSQSVSFLLTGEEMQVNVSGRIGYFFKVGKSSQSVGYQHATSSVNKQQNNDASNSYWINRNNDFRFMASIEQGEQQVTPIVYYGGIIKENNESKSIIFSRIMQNFERTKEKASQVSHYFEHRVFGQDIKPKRLFAGMIRDIHNLSQQSQQNNQAGHESGEQQQSSEKVKPSELASILARENGNYNITLLKLLTLAILLLSSLAVILQYVKSVSHDQLILSQLTNCQQLQELSAQIMYTNQFSTLFYNPVGPYPSLLTNTFTTQINQLDELTSSLPMGVQTEIAYNDGSRQTMILSFAVNKLISQAQQLFSAGSDSETSLFFTQYNSVNGIEKGCQVAINNTNTTLMNTNSQTQSIYVLYLAITGAVCFSILLLKNLLLRVVLKKKGEILNVFFQIPRYACNSIQKQCERFIQRLTLDEDDEMEIIQQAQEQEDASSSRRRRQKKRTVMGQEKTATNFILVSLFLLLFVLLYPTLVIVISNSSRDEQQYSFSAVTSLLSMQKQFAKAISFINTAQVTPNISLFSSSNAKDVISSQYSKINKLFQNAQQYLFYIGNIYSAAYRSNYNRLFFNPLCNQSLPSCTLYGQDKGINALMYYYFDYIVQKYNSYISNQFPAVDASYVQKQEQLRVLIKRYWREFSNLLLKSSDQFIKKSDTVLFSVMITICLLNLTVLMWAWMRFYNSLGQKIIATQYILTFIPIDEINKNPKIAKYIKEQVLRSQ